MLLVVLVGRIVHGDDQIPVHSRYPLMCTTVYKTAQAVASSLSDLAPNRIGIPYFKTGTINVLKKRTITDVALSDTIVPKEALSNRDTMYAERVGPSLQCSGFRSSVSFGLWWV